MVGSWLFDSMPGILSVEYPHIMLDLLCIAVDTGMRILVGDCECRNDGVLVLGSTVE